ncbi:MAG: S1C family serine protease [Chloroflexota bacterium]
MAGSVAPGASTATASGGTATAGGTSTTSGTGTVSIPDLIAQVSPSVVAILRADGAQGSGVVWDPSGIVITNNHVIEGVKTVTVAFADGTRADGTVQSADPRVDLAVVKVNRTNIPAASFRTTLPRVGETAIAIGNPLGFEGSVTEGIISGLGRTIPGSASTSPALVDLIQTDAPISPGNSGGAVVGVDGKVIGISVAYIPPSASAVSIGFAIPAPTVTDTIQQLIETGHVRHAFMGIEPATLDPETAQAYKLSVDQGAVILDVVSGGPAEKAGLKAGDVVTKFGDATIASAEDLLAALRKASPGDKVSVTYIRNGKDQTADVTLVDLPS